MREKIGRRRRREREKCCVKKKLIRKEKIRRVEVYSREGEWMGERKEQGRKKTWKIRTGEEERERLYEKVK